MVASDQLNLRLSPDFVEQLEKDAKRFGLKGKNSAATEIIETCYQHWVAMQEEMWRVRQSHLDKLAKPSEKRRVG